MALIDNFAAIDVLVLVLVLVVVIIIIIIIIPFVIVFIFAERNRLHSQQRLLRQTTERKERRIWIRQPQDRGCG